MTVNSEELYSLFLGCEAITNGFLCGVEAMTLKLRRLEDLDLAGKSVFLRLDLNVPIRDGKVEDDTRIRAALPTLRYILEKTNRVVVTSHLGRPKGQVDPKLSLEPVGRRLADLLGMEVVFVSDYYREPADQVLRQISQQQFVLLENLRFHEGETSNDRAFVDILTKGMDIYINDAFGTAHRAHASTVGVAERLPPQKRAAGFLIEKEIVALSRIVKAPDHPFTVVMGGAKVSDKIAVILNLLNHCNNLLIGGAMAYTFLKFRGLNVGLSRVEEDRLDLVEAIYRNADARKVSIHLPVDHIGGRAFAESASAETIDEEALPDHLMGLDIGPKTIEKFGAVIRDSQTVLWNGPMGVFEWPSFARGTMAIAQALADCSGATIIGGGDSVSAVNKAEVSDRITHISTGGGASLEFLEGKTLPGIKVLLA